MPRTAVDGSGKTKAELLDEAAEQDIEGRSQMSKAELEEALGYASDDDSDGAASEAAQVAAETTNPVEPTAKGGFVLGPDDAADADYSEPPDRQLRAANAWDASEVKTVTDQITKGTHLRTGKNGKQYQVGRVWTNSA